VTRSQVGLYVLSLWMLRLETQGTGWRGPASVVDVALHDLSKQLVLMWAVLLKLLDVCHVLLWLLINL